MIVYYHKKITQTPTLEHKHRYAAPTARGGILEPSGAVSIKFKDKELRKMALRLDAKSIALSKKLNALDKDDEKNREKVQAELEARVKSLLPVYRQIAEHFADLHDKPERMKAKGVIRSVVDWNTSRSFFYWRLRRRLAELDAVSRIREADSSLTISQASEILRESFEAGSEKDSKSSWECDNRRVLTWLTEQRASIQRKCRDLRKQAFVRTIRDMGQKDSTAVVSGVLSLLRELPQAQREKALSQLRRGVIFS